MPNISKCLFNFTLQGDDLSLFGSVGVLAVAGNKNVSYNITSIPAYLSLEYSMTTPIIPRLCIPAGEDIRTIVSAEFAIEEVNEIIVMEVRDDSSGCTMSSYKYFGRSARLIFNSSAPSECVL